MLRALDTVDSAMGDAPSLLLRPDSGVNAVAAAVNFVELAVPRPRAVPTIFHSRSSRSRGPPTAG